MDVKSLSSNWKRLQETLKKKDNASAPASTKRKPSEREPQNGAVKKRKKEVKEESKRSDHPRTSTKRKRMPENGESKGDSDVKSTSRRSSTSTAIAQSQTESKNGKVNEGRSQRSVLATNLLIALVRVCVQYSLTIPAVLS